MGLSVRLAGFDIRDGISWIYGSGFPKGQDMGKAVESRLTAGKGDSRDAKKWSGWKTQLKPANEPIILARKPFPGALVGNVMEHGVGALNIDANRVAAGDLEALQKNWNRIQSAKQGIASTGLAPIDLSDRKPDGRHPANVLLDEHAAEEMDKQSGNVNGVIGMKKVSGGFNFNIGEHTPQKFTKSSEHVKDSGGASRFFTVFKYQPKAPKKERPIIHHPDGTKTQHTTVKPLALMEWLVTLLTPEGGTVLDPFAGSGTTLEAARNNGFHSTGIEREEAYVALIHERLNPEH